MTLHQGPILTRRQLLETAGITGAAVSALALTPPAQAVTPPPKAARLESLPVAFGTPTDLARASRHTTWTRDADGTVLTYNKIDECWTPVHTHWRTVLTYGKVVLARWGHPSGPDQLVIVTGTPPRTPKSPPPLTPARPPLANTGVDATRLSLGGTALVALGAALLAFHRRLTTRSFAPRERA